MKFNSGELYSWPKLMVVLFSGFVFSACVQVSAGDQQPVNYLKYSDNFASAGQPDVQFIDVLASEGVELVINIAPSTSHGSMVDEGHHVSKNGMTYLNIPVDWHEPDQDEVSMFLHLMKNQTDKNVFLHCQMNMRASAYAFLHRVINLQIDPEEALASMQQIWTPNKTWAKLINESLARNNIDFVVPSQKTPES